MADGFQVLCYTTDDPIIARRLKEAGATSVMPAGSPIGSGQGVLNPNNIRICLEYLKDDDPDYPVIVDAGVGTASDVTIAMELGVDGVLLNTGIAHAKDPLRMADAMRHATEAGRLAYLAGRIPKRLYATASSPDEGVITREAAVTVRTRYSLRRVHLLRWRHGTTRAADILGPDGRIAARLANYEQRPQQLEMADAVARAIAGEAPSCGRSGHGRRQELCLSGAGDSGGHGARSGRSESATATSRSQTSPRRRSSSRRTRSACKSSSSTRTCRCSTR